MENINKNPLLEKIFNEHNNPESLKISWEDFINYALFDKDFGYYQQNKKRVGGDDADFYTSVSLKEKVFSELIYESAKTLVSPNNLSDFQFLEIGAEPDNQIIQNAKVIRLNQNIQIPERAIIISNELLDARPFDRFKFCNNKWLKASLIITKNDFTFTEIFENPTDFQLYLLDKYFPKAKVENFRIDLSLDALNLFENICKSDWKGAIIFADYFRYACELSELPNGTARAYFKHKDSTDLTKNVGNQDITFSPCTDMLIDIANKYNFNICDELKQESFFMRFAQEKIKEIITSDNPLDFRKRELAQLISPVYMGASFRILYATRF